MNPSLYRINLVELSSLNLPRFRNMNMDYELTLVTNQSTSHAVGKR